MFSAVHEAQRLKFIGAIRFIDDLLSTSMENRWVQDAHRRLGINQPADPTPQASGTEWMESDS